ncbi:MAG: LamG-like jellyroll fold domain-containing protein [Candidatus Brocadiia bacterium]
MKAVGRIPIILCLLAGLGGGAPRPLEGPRPLHGPGTADEGLRIEWKDGWEATVEANKERWEEAARRARGDERQRLRRLFHVRMVRLYEGLLERFPDQRAARPEAYHALARHLDEIGCRGRAHYARKRLIDRFPGRPELAREALVRILEDVWRDPHDTEEGEAWLHYAATRLVALHQAGHLPASHPAVALAWKARFEQALREGRFWEAAQTLRRLEASSDGGEAWRVAQARLYYGAGRAGEARRRFQDLAAEGVVRANNEWLRRLGREGEGLPVSFPAMSPLEARWDAMRAGRPPLDARVLGELLDRCAKHEAVVPVGRRRHASLWTAIDRHLAAVGVPPALRTAKEREALREVRAARRDDDAARLLAAYRRWPWARPVHAALLEAAEQALRRGQPGLAERTFHDVATHAAELDLRRPAQVGLGLAEAAGARRESLEVGLSALPDDAPVPWMGAERPAGEVKGRLRAAARRREERPAPRLSQFAVRALRPPRVAPWVVEWFRDAPEDLIRLFPSHGELCSMGGRVLLSGPNLLACFGREGTAPRWARTPGGWRGRGEEDEREDPWPCLTAPGPFAPVLVEGMVVSRWGLDRSGRHPTGLAALDAATGEMRWSTAGQEHWEELWPLGDPAAAEGRVYTLATREAFSTLRPVYLVALDGATGRTLWQRFLGSQHLGVRRADGAPRLRGDAVDLASYGSGLAVHRGAVYCSTNVGFVARCDARDGLLEWARTYPRVRLGSNIASVLRRRGGAPLVVGDVVVATPRDYQGALALDRRTGQLRWDRPFVPSERMPGRVGGRVVLAGRDHVVALDAQTGETAWQRHLPVDLRGRVAPVGDGVLVLSRGKLLRLAADTGLTVDERPLELGSTPRGFAVLDDALAVVAEEPPERPGEPLAPQAESRPLRLPLREAWHLPRSDPWMWRPPPEAEVPERVYLFSDGVLECVRAGPRGALAWQRLLPGSFRDLVWAKKTLVFIYPRRVVALDALTGRRRWEGELDFAPDTWATHGPYLLLGHYRRDCRVALFRLDDGQRLWDTRFRGALARADFDHSGWDGEFLYLVARRTRHGREAGPAVLAVRPSDGRIVGWRRFPAGGEPWPKEVAYGQDFAFCVSRQGSIFTVSFLDGELTRYPVELERSAVRGIDRLAVSGPWLELRWHRRFDDQEKKHWLLRRDQPGTVLRRQGPGRVAGTSYLESPDERTLLAVDLANGQEARYQLPSLSRHGGPDGVLACRRAGDRVWTLAVHAFSHRGSDHRLRVDVFDRRTGEHLEGQLLRRVLGRRARAVWTDDVLVVRSVHGLHGFVAAGEEAEPAPPTCIAYGVEREIRVDGSLDDWPEGPGVALEGDPRRVGTVRMTHSPERLYLAVSYRDSHPLPRAGRGTAGGGDWLELGITTDAGSFRWGVGLASGGKAAWEALGTAPVPEMARAAVAQELASNMVTYELALPREALLRSPGDRQLGLSLAVWDERGDGRAARRVLALGDALATPTLLPVAHREVYLHPRTRQQEQALAAIVHAVPDLPASIEAFQRSCEVRGGSAAELAEHCWAFIRRHPRSVATERLLLLVDQALRREGAESTAAILERAARAGVPESVRRRFATWSRAALSQWVHLAGRSGIRSLMVELCDGTGGQGRDEWGHRAVWGKPARHWAVPPVILGRVDDLPEGRWHELRIPLYAVGMHDRPVCGIGFVQQGGPRIVWDRSAVVADGREEVFLDDQAPPGRLLHDWQWTEETVHSGRRAHAHEPPPRHYALAAHTLAEMERPVVAHLVPPLDRPYLSQWVWLDPQDPPEMLSLDLHDGEGWRCTAVWGTRRRKGRYMGPLPRPGRWHELRLPLAWTPFRARPIGGVAFGLQGGRAVWDRTAVVVDGRTHVVMDEEPPALLDRRQPRPWLGWLLPDGYRHVGRTTPFGGKRGAGAHFDGATGYVEVPHSPALEPEHLTLEAWLYITRYPTGGEDRRWLVNKNTHECTESHYALVIKHDYVGTYLNIGDEDEGRFSAWSEPGSLALRRWQHLAMAYDGATLELYLDGQKVAATAVNRERVPGRTPLHIGRRQDGYVYYEGMLDEVRLYDRALSEEEVRARAAADGAPPPEPLAQAVVGHWSFDDAVAAVRPLGDADRVARPVHAGKWAYELSAPEGFLGHFAAPLAEPVLAHLPHSPQQVAKVLREHLPRLGAEEEGWLFVADLLALEAAAERRLETLEWFFGAFPRHPRQDEALALLLAAHRRLGTADPRAAVVAFARKHEVALTALYRHYRRHGKGTRRAVRAWQVLGPFLNPGGRPFGPKLPPDGRPVELERAYQGAGGEVRWRAHHSEADRLDFDSLFEPDDRAVAYAAFWLRSPRRQAAFAVGSDDECTVWLNGRQVLRGDNAGYVRPGEFVRRVELEPGWNEVLVKVSESTGQWRLVFEVLDPLARGPLGGMELRSTPPG